MITVESTRLSAFVVCDMDGNIRRTGSAPAEMVELQALDGELAFELSADQQSQYVDIETKTACNKSPMNTSVIGATVSNLPDPCTASVEGQKLEITGGEAEFEFDVPGEYSITLSANKFLPCTITVTQT